MAGPGLDDISVFQEYAEPLIPNIEAFVEAGMTEAEYRETMP